MWIFEATHWSANGCLRHSPHVTARGEPRVLSVWVRVTKKPFFMHKLYCALGAIIQNGTLSTLDSVSRSLLAGRCSQNSAPDQTGILVTARRTTAGETYGTEDVEIAS